MQKVPFLVKYVLIVLNQIHINKTPIITLEEVTLQRHVSLSNPVHRSSFFFPCLLTIPFLSVKTVCVCVHAHLCSCVLRLETDILMSSSIDLHTLDFETASLIETGAC